MTSSLVNAAVVQAGSVVFDTPATLVRLAELTREVAGRGADIGVFPEAFVGGYPKGLDFEARLGSRTPEGTSFSCQPDTIAEATEGSRRC